MISTEADGSRPWTRTASLCGGQEFPKRATFTWFPAMSRPAERIALAIISAVSLSMSHLLRVADFLLSHVQGVDELAAGRLHLQRQLRGIDRVAHIGVELLEVLRHRRAL